ncbi:MULTISPECIES: class I SAM-dependent methyltransferase [unclassified Nocardioides]|uniref:class I SAM-dependent methyltransferase n=1 Tax=unclassified Nocardioides TaxID=2615069 RepID=UPI0007025B2D|nr:MULTISPECIES: class I SAM-dependent methyltransferase [unclassified Nocardioides]KQP64673.1 cyclopropane-fatty-acyl-phospholipid synthase [Nocardioides sp. Leaf285]KQQ43677.1 cyclopropane-fatty-acyl-phospholipid synthase [Nocardioides sp. Leaf307]
MTGPTTSTLTIGQAVETLLRDGMPVRFRAYDGSVAGPPDAELGLELRTPRGLSYLLTAPGDLGMARAYVSGDLVVHGVHPGDPYAVMRLLQNHLRFRKPTPGELVTLVRGLGLGHLKPPPPPPQEHLPRWRRAVEGLRHSLTRDAEVISHHYDVSNAFYRHVLGPSMAYTCAVYPDADASLEEAQAEKFDLVCRKLDLKPGQRLLDVGCGWGGMVRHAAREYGVKALGVTLSREQASWAKEAIDRDGLGDLAEVRHSDYREVLETDFDAVSSIGLLEHVGVRNYPAYFSFLRERLRPEGRLLNHCITRHDNAVTETGAFIDRYVFPDGELTGSGTIIATAQDAGLEVVHEENLRRHYAMTLRDWCANLVEHWDECVAEVGEGTARVWGLYMAGSRLGFERNEIQLHQVLAVRTGEDGSDGLPLRPTW